MESSSKGLRSSKSIKKGCEWKAKAVYMVKTKTTKTWRFFIQHQDHNHDLDVERAGFLPGHRRMARNEDVIASILRQSKQPKATSSDIVAAIREEFPGVEIKNRDVINVIAHHKAELAGTLSPTQQFIQHLTTTPGIHYRIYRQGGSKDGKIQRVFWTYD